MGVVVEHIVGIADPALVRHTGQLHLVEPILALDPARVDEHGVYVELAGLVFGEVERLGRVVLPLGLTAGGELGAQGGVLLHECGELRRGRGLP